MKKTVLLKAASIILINLEENISLCKLGVKSNITYSHTHKIKEFLKKNKYLYAEGNTKTHKIKLTKKGEKLQYHLLKINELI